MKVNKTIDWISVTIPNNRQWKGIIPMAEWELTGKGRHGYGQAWLDKRSGARVETKATRDDMGTHITLSGDVMRVLRDDMGGADEAIIHRVEKFDGKCSRVDLAIDCFGCEFTPSDLNHDLGDKTAKFRARTWRYIDGHRAGINGATVDTGSPKSDVRFRFYDKRAERGVKDGDAWVRFELQLRRVYARACITTMAVSPVSPVIAGYIGDYLDWQIPEYYEAIGLDSIDTPTIKRKDGNRQKWLLGQVASALAVELADNPFFRERFNQATNEFLRVIVDKRNKQR